MTILFLLLLCPAAPPAGFSTVEVAIPLNGPPPPGPLVMVTYTDVVCADFRWRDGRGYEMVCINHRLEIVGAALDRQVLDGMSHKVNAVAFMGIPAGRLKMTYYPTYDTFDRGRGREPKWTLYFIQSLPGDLDFDDDRVDFWAAMPLARGPQ